MASNDTDDDIIAIVLLH